MIKRKASTLAQDARRKHRQLRKRDALKAGFSIWETTKYIPHARKNQHTRSLTICPAAPDAPGSTAKRTDVRMAASLEANLLAIR
jgi:hypothetical protein